MLNGESACALRDSGGTWKWRLAGKDPESVIKKKKLKNQSFSRKIISNIWRVPIYL